MCPGGYPIKEAENWQSGFLPGVYQGTYIDSQHTKIEKLIEHIRNNYTSLKEQREQLDLLHELNEEHQQRRQQDARLEARIQSYELAAKLLTRNLLQYVSAWKPARPRKVIYAGDPAGKAHLEGAGFVMASYAGAKLSPEEILIIGTGGGKPFLQHTVEIGAWLKAGGHLLTFGATPEDLDAMRKDLIDSGRAAEIPRYFHFKPIWQRAIIVGAGPTGVEMAGAIAVLVRSVLRSEFRRIDPGTVRIVLIDMAPRVLGSFAEDLSRAAQARPSTSNPASWSRPFRATRRA
jgi:DNA-binding transcriptional MerR regulator